MIPRRAPSGDANRAASTHHAPIEREQHPSSGPSSRLPSLAVGKKPRIGEALNGTTALHAIALNKGAQILRVHDVKEAVQCVQLVQCVAQYNY